MLLEAGEIVNAERTGLYVVAVYEGTGRLLAVHGPYADAKHARLAAETARDGDRAEFYPLWHPEHVGRD